MFDRIILYSDHWTHRRTGLDDQVCADKERDDSDVFTDQGIDSSSPNAFYHDLAVQLAHLIAGETDDIANLSNASALLHLHLTAINWVGFYLWHERTGELVLGPFQGKPACIRIPVGKGVCGTAVARREVMVVEDVHAFPGHIACDAASRSEIVVPMYIGDRLVGVLDIDAPLPGRFGPDDKDGLTEVVATLLQGTEFALR